MNQRALLRKTMALAKTGDTEAFENLYILTVEDTYAKIRNAVRDIRAAEGILVDTYVMLHRYIRELPTGEDDLEDMIDQIALRILHRKTSMEIGSLYSERDYPKISEDRAATLLLWIEEKAGIVKERPKRNENTLMSDLINAGRIFMTIVIIGITGFVLYRGWNLITRDEIAESVSVTEAKSIEAAAISTEAQIVIEKEKLSPGWEQKEDGNLYYVTKDGEMADQTLAIGKQILTFSSQGALTFIGSNRAVSENPNVSYDEKIRYEVKNGDVYQRNMEYGSQGSSVTKNGHVVQADVRCGYLWYICKYQVPNSNQVKTTIYRSGLNGENQEEVFTTTDTLNAEQFQLTEDWMYYISDGMLLRKSLEDGKVQLMAEQVEYYFAWEDTAYYMKDRVLERTSEGVDYSGIEAGYEIEMHEDGFVLLDREGELVTPDANGEKQVGDRIYTISEGLIVSVRPSEREDNGVVYFINSAGSERKIYSKNSAGSQGLIRQDGIAADSLCIAGEWLYYSARVEQFENEIASQIFRLNLQTLESEAVGDGFEGYMKNLYYFDELQSIFAEYIPSAENPENIQGNIALIPVGGEPKSLEVQGALPASDPAYILEFVSADAARVYCLYHTYSYNGATGLTEWISSVPMEIPYR